MLDPVTVGAIVASLCCVCGSFALFVVVVALFLRSRKKKKKAPATAKAPQLPADPWKKWSQAAFAVLSDGKDLARAEKASVSRLLANDFQIVSFDDLRRSLASLEGGWATFTGMRPIPKERPVKDVGPAWDLVRAMTLSRGAVAMGWMTEDDSWSMVKNYAERLQTAYDDWDPMTEALLVCGRRARNLPEDGSRDDGTIDAMARAAEGVAELRGSLPFKMKLSS